MRATRFGSCAIFVIALFLANAIGTTAADFEGPTSYIDLPGFRPDEVNTKVVVGKGVAPTSTSNVTVLVLNPDAEAKGAVVSYEVVDGSGPQTWVIEGLTKSKQRKPVANLSIEGHDLAFQWVSGVLKTDGTPLRNCVLGVVGATEHAVALRIPLKQSSLLLDMSKELSRLPLFDDLPEDGLLLTAGNVEGATVSNEHSADTVGLKTPLFVGLKGAEAAVPGARLRIILWKTSLKPEVIVRPELVPMDPTAGLTGTSQVGVAPTGIPGLSIGQPKAAVPSATPNVNDGSDPTKSSTTNLPYTIRTLTAGKATVGRDLAAARSQIATLRNQTAVKQAELNRLSGSFTGTADEIQAIVNRRSRLQGEIGALLQQVGRIEEFVVPPLEKQLAAFPALETLGNSLHQKATIGLRVYYTVGGKQVDVLVAEGAPAAKK